MSSWTKDNFLGHIYGDGLMYFPPSNGLNGERQTKKKRRQRQERNQVQYCGDSPATPALDPKTCPIFVFSSSELPFYTFKTNDGRRWNSIRNFGAPTPEGPRTRGLEDEEKKRQKFLFEPGTQNPNLPSRLADSE